jgi:hypothetical protein
LAGWEATSLPALRSFRVSYELIIPTGISDSGILHEDLNLRGADLRKSLPINNPFKHVNAF